MIDLHDVTEHLNLIASDPALLQSFRKSNPAFVDLCRVIVPPPEPVAKRIGFPPINTMTAIQAAIFDNWPQGRRADGHPNRYAMTIELWTAPADQISVAKRNYQQKATAILMDRKTILGWLKTRVRENPKKKEEYRSSDGFLLDLAELADNMQDGDHIGLFAHKVKGYHYFDRQLVYVRLDGLDTECTFIVDGVALDLPKFSPFKPNSAQPLGGPVWLQSRADLCGFSTAWATEDHAS